MDIIISGKSKKLLQLIKDLAIELGLSIKDVPKIQKKKMTDSERSEKLYELMENSAKQNLFNSIEDPVAWQHDQRKEKSLPGR